MASCGISVNLSALETSVSSHIALVAGKAPVMALPYAPVAIYVALAASRGNLLGAISAVVNIDALVDKAWSGFRGAMGDLVDGALAEGITGLSDDTMATVFGKEWASRGDLNILQDSGQSGSSFFKNLASTVNDFGGDIANFADKSGLSNLSGYVDIDVLDLAKSSIGLGASFNECDFGVSGIRNFYRDPVSGGVKLLANYAPKIGDTILASGLSSYGMDTQAYLNFKSGKASSILNINLNSIASSVGDYALDRIGTISSSTDLKAISDNIKESVTPSQNLFQKKMETGETMLVDEDKEAKDLYQDVYDTILGE